MKSKKKSNYINRLYERNPQTGNYIIEVSLDSYIDIFNDWDHASYKKRDIDPELVRFVEDCAMDIPSKYDLDICFYLPKELQNKEKEKIIISGFRTYYTFYIHTEQKNLNISYGKVASYVIISFLLMAFSFIFDSYISGILSVTLLQGLTVGGWVFLWEAISFFSFQRRDILKNINNYKRLATANIYFRYDTI